MILETIALTLAAIHFGVPLSYYYYMKHKYLNKPWNLKTDENYRPKVTIIIPTYNEAKLIKTKLDNIHAQDYPKELIEIIVIDSGSPDGTADIVREWASKCPEIKLYVIEENERRGMVHALNYGLRCANIGGEILIFTDVDAFWDKNTLTKVIMYFADLEVGAVTTNIVPIPRSNDSLEKSYRNYYNTIRLAESKAHSTPIHNGALIAYRTKLLYKIGGLPYYTGNNDSAPASLIAFMGYRAIHTDSSVVKEPQVNNQLSRKIRRAQHLLLTFLKTKTHAKKLGIYKSSKYFEKIWKIEWWLHVVNPWLLITCVLLIITGTIYGFYLATILLGLGLAFLILRPYRTWMMQQLYLVIAMIKNSWTKTIMWNK